MSGFIPKILYPYSVTKDGQVRIVMSNQNLIEQMYHLLRSFGQIVGICKSVNVALSKEYYARLDLSKNSRFVKQSNKFYADDRIINSAENIESKQRNIVIDGQSFVRIDSKIKSNLSPEYVYTFGVEEYHSYPVEGLILDISNPTPPRRLHICVNC